MILTLSSLVIILCLLSFTVILLRQYQVREGQAIAERFVPLGPNDHDADLSQLKLSNGWSGETTISESLLARSTLSSVQPPSTPASLLASSTAKIARDDEFPMLGAFNTRSITLRRALRDATESESNRTIALNSLYRNAAVAELLHGKNSQGRIPLARLKSLPEQFIDELDMPYQAIGYKKLKLLRRSDVQQMRAAWGDPEEHQCPRDYHRQRWNTLYNHYG
ncbi:MAG: hypothetical protein AB8B95_01575 [Pseudohongiellaceae bacterium]